MAATDQLGAEIAQRWPNARVDAQLLAECAGRGGDALADLYLATAAARAETWALDAFERDVFIPVRDRLARLHARAPAEEATQLVREQLLVKPGGLATYSGRGPLRAWVMVIAARRLLSLRTQQHDSLSGLGGLVSAEPAEDRLQLMLLRARYAGVFKAALERALDSLDRRERLLLRMSTVDGLSAEKIGAIFHAHRATATEWLAKARATLHERMTVEVQREAGLTAAELDSIGRVLQRHTDFSLPRLLAGREAEAQ